MKFLVPLKTLKQEKKLFIVAILILVLSIGLIWAINQVNYQTERKRVLTRLAETENRAKLNINNLESSLLNIEEKSYNSKTNSLFNEFLFLYGLQINNKIYYGQQAEPFSSLDKIKIKIHKELLIEQLRNSGLRIARSQALNLEKGGLHIIYVIRGVETNYPIYAYVSIKRLIDTSNSEPNRFLIELVEQERSSSKTEEQAFSKNYNYSYAFPFPIAGAVVTVIATDKNNIFSYFNSIFIFFIPIFLGLLGVWICWQLLKEIHARKVLESMITSQEKRIQRHEDLSILGEMTTLISHEINQPLASIEIYASLCEKKILSKNKVENDYSNEICILQKNIKGEVDRIKRFITGTRSVIKDNDSQTLNCDVSQAIENIKPLVLLYAEKMQVEIRFSVEPKLYVKCTSVAIEQICMNLIRNGIESMETQASSLRFLEITAKSDRDKWVQVAVSDRGSGVSPEVAPQIFKPLYTTKASGTGIGLSLCKRLIEKCGGKIWFEPNSRIGTTFFFAVPKQ